MKRPKRAPSPLLPHNVRLESECPVCRTAYHVADARLVEEGDNSNLIRVECGKCHSALLVLVVSDPRGVASYAVLTDLGEEEVPDFSARQPLSADDCIAFHSLLKTPDASWV